MTTEYNCYCSMQITTKDAEALFCKYITLPFAPPKGLELEFSEDQDNPDWFLIDSVEYSVPEDIFYLTGKILIGDTSCPCQPGDKCCVLREDYYINHGWELISIRRGYDRLHDYDWIFEPHKTGLGKMRELLLERKLKAAQN